MHWAQPFTDINGRFALVAYPEDFGDWLEQRPDPYLRIYAPDGEDPLFSTEDAIRWNAQRRENFDVRIPRARLGRHAPKRELKLIGDDGRERHSFQVGEPLGIRASGLAPGVAHDVSVSDADNRPLFSVRCMVDRKGTIRGTTIWPQLGLHDPHSSKLFSVEKALQTWGGRTLRLKLSRDGQTLMEVGVSVADNLERPLVLSTDREGFPRSGFEAGRAELVVSGYNLQEGENYRVYMVRRQFDWRAGDPFESVLLAGGRSAWADAEVDQTGGFQLLFARAEELVPGAYDFIVRRIRYGREDGESRFLRKSDVVGYRTIAGLVVREDFTAAKFARGGCVNVQAIAGRPLEGPPHFQHSDVFQVGEDVWAALDPGALDPEWQGKMVALYVVPHRTAEEWSGDSGLIHLAELGGNDAVPILNVQPDGIGSNMALLWPNAAIEGEYDIVADLGNNTSDAEAFTPDDTFNAPLDFIDGFVTAGFRVIPDPSESTTFQNCGSFTYEEESITVTDEVAAFDPYLNEDPDFSATDVPVRAIVYFPADAPGATEPDQISAEESSYPIFVAVHGNSADQESYLGYNYLLEHVAKNGFIAASIHLNGGMRSQGRAEVLFHHLDRIKGLFGTNAADQIALMGHSRGGEAVVAAARMALIPAVPPNIEVVISIAPTDHYGRQFLGEAWPKPFLVLYGSMDGDVHGGLYQAGALPRRSGFSIYDRCYGSPPKTMVFVYGVTHGRFNTQWGNVDLQFLPWEEQQQVISSDAHHTIARGYITAFLRRHMFDETQYDGILKGDWAPAAVEQADEGNVRLYVQYEGTDRLLIDAFVENPGANGWQVSHIGGDVDDDNTLPTVPEENWLHEVDLNSPHETGGLRLRWNGLNDRIRFSLPAAQDVSGFTIISFRVTQRTGSLANPGGAQDFYLSLTDSGGNSRQIRVSHFAEIPEPHQRLDTMLWEDATKSAMRTVRIPLSAYTIEVPDLDPVDLTSVTEIAFHFGMHVTGEIEIDSLMFADGTPGFQPPEGIRGVITAREARMIPERSPTHPEDVAARLRWQAAEVVRDLNGRPRLFERLTLYAPEFQQIAQEPFVRAGALSARFVEIAADGLQAHAYFDQPIPEGAKIRFGYGESAVRYQYPEVFVRTALETLDRERLPEEVELPAAAQEKGRGPGS